MQIVANGRTENVRGIRDEAEAAKKYDELAVRLHGYRAQLNFPQPKLLAALEMQARKRGDFGSRWGSSIFRGVSLKSYRTPARKRLWTAHVRVDGRQVFLGCFSDEVAAAHSPAVR